MDDVIGCNWLLTQLNGLKVEEKENYNSKFLCQNATCRLKNNQENNQKSQKKLHRFFYRKTKQNQDQTENGCSMLRIKKTNTHLYYYVILMFHGKKIKLIVRNRKSLIVHHPKTDRKQPEPLN